MCVYMCGKRKNIVKECNLCYTYFVIDIANVTILIARIKWNILNL